MKNPAALEALLLRHEAKRRKPYDDKTGKELRQGDRLVGKLTIGIGRNLTDVGLRDDEIALMHLNDIRVAVQDLEQNFPWFNDLDEVRQVAVADFRFNLGPGGFRNFRRSTIPALARGDYGTAVHHMKRTPWFTQTKSRGRRIVAMIQTGEWQV